MNFSRLEFHTHCLDRPSVCSSAYFFLYFSFFFFFGLSFNRPAQRKAVCLFPPSTMKTHYLSLNIFHCPWMKLIFFFFFCAYVQHEHSNCAWPINLCSEWEKKIKSCMFCKCKIEEIILSEKRATWKKKENMFLWHFAKNWTTTKQTVVDVFVPCSPSELAAFNWPLCFMSCWPPQVVHLQLEVVSFHLALERNNNNLT